MTTHRDATLLLRSLDAEAGTIATLLDYVSAQERGPRADDNLSDREHSIRAANRAVEAISRVGTLTSDFAAKRTG